MSKGLYIGLLAAQMLLAAAIFVFQISHFNAWPIICTYWGCVTIKNCLDFRAYLKKDSSHSR